MRAPCGGIGYVMDAFGVLFDAVMGAQDFCPGAMACWWGAARLVRRMSHTAICVEVMRLYLRERTDT